MTLGLSTSTAPLSSARPISPMECRSRAWWAAPSQFHLEGFEISPLPASNPSPPSVLFNDYRIMADPASIAVGVIPLVAVAFKSYTAVHSKFSTFVHCSNRVAQFQKRLKFQRRIFENEGHLLLRFAIDDEAVIASMKRNHSHEKWAESEVDEKLKQKLGDNYQDCLEIVQDTKKALDSIQEQLDAFNEFIKYQRKVRNEPVEDTHLAA
jgi:hypothetical protein